MKRTVYLSTVVVALVLLVDLTHGQIPTPKSFEGYQVLRIKIESEAQLERIWNLEDVDFWTEPAIGAWFDVMVNPSKLQSSLDHLEKEHLNWTVKIPNVGSVIEEQKVAKENRNKADADFWTEYQGLNEIYGWMDSLELSFANLVSTETIGQSHEDRPIRLLKISKSTTSDSSRPAVFLDSGIHAREWISPATLTFIVDNLLTDPQYDDIFDTLDLHVVPVLNPDGYDYTFTTDRMWRKNRKPNPGTECFGTDLNRNFPFEWCTIGASNDSCSDNYCGSAPGSEPETQVIVNYLSEDFNWWGYVTIHSYAQEWCIPWAYTTSLASHYDDMMVIGRKAVDALEAVHGTPYILKIPSGRYGGFSMDWAKGIREIKYPVLIELRDQGNLGFLLPPEQIIPSGQETLAAIVVYLREIIEEVKQTRSSGNNLASWKNSFTVLISFSILKSLYA